MDNDTRVQALEIALGAVMAMLRDVNPAALATAGSGLRAAISSQRKFSVFPGESEIATPMALERALVLLQAAPLPTGRA